MSYQTNITRIRAVANALESRKDKIVFVGGATVSLYASRPLAIAIRPTDDVDVVIELISLKEFYNLQEELLKLGLSTKLNQKLFQDFYCRA